MNRTLLLGLAVLLGLAGIAISVRDAFQQEQPPPPRVVAVAKVDIPTYTRIEADMLEKREIPADQAQFVYGYEEAIGKISTEPIKVGQTIGRGEAKPIEEVRFVEDLGMEITSFSGRFDEMVGGQLKPGVRVNIYGYLPGRDQENPGDVKLIARNVWVVDVRASSGESATPREPSSGNQEESGGFLGGPQLAGRSEVPASIVTVAAEPDVVLDIIGALGADGYQAWVTLAGNQAANVPTYAEAQPTYTPLPTYTPFPTPATPDLDATPAVDGIPTPSELPTTGQGPLGR